MEIDEETNGRTDKRMERSFVYAFVSVRFVKNVQ